jgi:D-beta-D-heptose 7-phosphate kinase/D-beta-D-heptose 1-phosphate adenosyltransferase
MIDLTLLQRLGQASVLVVGDVMLDRYYQGDTQRISPEAPVPVVKVNSVQDKAGGAANVARNIAHLDGQVGLLGIVGDDAQARSLEALLSHEHIRSHLHRQSHQPTITKTRIVSRQQQVVRLDQEEVFDDDASQALVQAFARTVGDYPLVLFSDYNKGSLRHLPEMMTMAKAAGKTVLVDPKHPDFAFYRGADIVTPNLSEFKAAGGLVHSEAAMVESARAMLTRCGITAMLLTRSEQGMSWITTTEHQHFPAQVREVSDVTGAGDTVIATLAVMMGAGMSPAQASEVANVAAGIVVGKVGAATVSPKELAVQLNHHWHSQGGLYQTPFEQVLNHIAFARQTGERIVFTNGCFDILHAGHVRYLAQARALGDRLVVGLNSDASVRRLKGAQRPVNPIEDRATVLSALASVDWVLPFGDDAEEGDTPLRLIQQVVPDVLVKGGDYRIDQIVGADWVLARGGQVQVLDFVEGRSTSGVIQKIQGNH